MRADMLRLIVERARPPQREDMRRSYRIADPGQARTCRWRAGKSGQRKNFLVDALV